MIHPRCVAVRTRSPAAGFRRGSSPARRCPACSRPELVMKSAVPTTVTVRPASDSGPARLRNSASRARRRTPRRCRSPRAAPSPARVASRRSQSGGPPKLPAASRRISGASISRVRDAGSISSRSPGTAGKPPEHVLADEVERLHRQHQSVRTGRTFHGGDVVGDDHLDAMVTQQRRPAHGRRRKMLRQGPSARRGGVRSDMC